VRNFSVFLCVIMACNDGLSHTPRQHTFKIINFTDSFHRLKLTCAI